MTDEPTVATRGDESPTVVVIHRTVARASRIYAIAASLLAATAAIGLVATMVDRDGWRDVAQDLRVQNADLQADLDAQKAQIDAQTEEQQCRSQAAFDTDEKASEIAITTALALAAVGRGESPAPYADQLELDAADYRAAIDARAVSLSTCTVEEDP
jgi:hypothetical protein